jgi:hypothetical protein
MKRSIVFVWTTTNTLLWLPMLVRATRVRIHSQFVAKQIYFICQEAFYIICLHHDKRTIMTPYARACKESARSLSICCKKNISSAIKHSIVFACTTTNGLLWLPMRVGATRVRVQCQFVAKQIYFICHEAFYSICFLHNNVLLWLPMRVHARRVRVHCQFVAKQIYFICHEAFYIICLHHDKRTIMTPYAHACNGIACSMSIRWNTNLFHLLWSVL